MRAVPHTRQAPLLDQMLLAKMRPRYAGLLAREGPLRPVAGSPRSGPSTARMGNPQVAAIVCLVLMVDPNPDADGGAVHTSSQSTSTYILWTAGTVCSADLGPKIKSLQTAKFTVVLLRLTSLSRPHHRHRSALSPPPLNDYASCLTSSEPLALRRTWTQRSSHRPAARLSFSASSPYSSASPPPLNDNALARPCSFLHSQKSCKKDQYIPYVLQTDAAQRRAHQLLRPPPIPPNTQASQTKFYINISPPLFVFTSPFPHSNTLGDIHLHNLCNHNAHGDLPGEPDPHRDRVVKHLAALDAVDPQLRRTDDELHHHPVKGYNDSVQDGQEL
ncbi:hypothetical protein EI94DRAFT_1813190 [Lactarius quietus]|nr:hypothetical protein EI94DRAFT_1813190 [Lactarius quietus]